MSMGDLRDAERAMKKRDAEMGEGNMRRGLFYGTLLCKIISTSVILTKFNFQMRVMTMKMVALLKGNVAWPNVPLKEWKSKMNRPLNRLKTWKTCRAIRSANGSPYCPHALRFLTDSRTFYVLTRMRRVSPCLKKRSATCAKVCNL